MNREAEKQSETISEKIRESVNMTQETLSAKLQLRGCDITCSVVAKIEVGQRHLYADEIILIKEILNGDFEEIFYGK